MGSSMIRPEVRAVEGEGAAWKRNTREIFHLRRFLSRIEARNAPIFSWLFRSAQDIDQSVDEHMTAKLCADINAAQNVSGCIEFQDAMLVPLTQVKMIAVEAQI